MAVKKYLQNEATQKIHISVNDKPGCMNVDMATRGNYRRISESKVAAAASRLYCRNCKLMPRADQMLKTKRKATLAS